VDELGGFAVNVVLLAVRFTPQLENLKLAIRVPQLKVPFDKGMY
jgi:hypothetical protein